MATSSKMEMKEANAGEAQPPEDPFLVMFTQPTDKDNPKDWPRRRKWMVTSVLSASSFNRIMISTIMAPALTTIGRELHMTGIEPVMAMSMYVLATAFGPLVFGPLSELYGRSVVLHCTNVWFLVFNILCGFAHNKQTLLAGRFFAGLGASSVYALVGGVLGDVWRPEERGRTLGNYALMPLLGAAIGPILGGFISEYSTWRWIFWSTSAVQGVLTILSFIMFRETYAPVILGRKAARLRKLCNDDRYQSLIERFETGRSVTWVLRKSLTRPLRMLLTHPIAQSQAIISGLSYGFLYLILSTFSEMWTTRYHYSLTISGLHYLAPALGEIIGAKLGGPILDKTYRLMAQRADGVPQPEFRMPVMIPGSIAGACGLLMYGWAAQGRAPWIVVDIGVLIWSCGEMIEGQALTAYTIDSYPDHASSASAASQFARSMTAFSFPLFAPSLYRTLQYGWGNSVLALCALIVGIPAPLLIAKYGPRWRERTRDSY